MFLEPGFSNETGMRSRGKPIGRGCGWPRWSRSNWRRCDETDHSYTAPLIRLDTVGSTRPHLFAKERVGFLTAGIGNNGDIPALILMRQYYPVSDEHYVDDPYSGARICGAGIREALQRALETQEATYHVHMRSEEHTSELQSPCNLVCR